MSMLRWAGIDSMWAGDTCIYLRTTGGAWQYEPCSSKGGKPVYRWHYT